MTQPEGGYRGRRYESEVYAEAAGNGSWIGPTPGEVAGRYSDKSGQLYSKSLEGHGGGYRGGLPPSENLYETYSHEDLVDMVTVGVSPEEVDEQGIIVNDLGNAFGEMAGALRDGVAKEQASWQGDGASSAFGYFNTLATWAEGSRDAAYLSANRYSQTSAALEHARNSMPEPAGRSIDDSFAEAQRQFRSGDWQAASATLNDAENQALLQHEAQQQAAAVLAQRDVMLHSGGSTQPVYATPSTAPGTDQATTPSFAGNDGTSASGAGGGIGPMGGTPGGVRSTGSIAPPTAPVPGPGPATGAAPGLGEGTGGGWGRAPGTVPGAATTAPGGGVVPMAPGRPEQPRGTSRPGAGRTGVTPRAGVGARAAGGGGAAGRLGGGAAGEGAGRRAGVAEPGARAAAESAGSGRGGAAGKPGAPGAGMGGAAGNRKKEEDAEHETPAYLLEDDPDSVFGLDGGHDEQGNRISPPVIGG